MIAAQQLQERRLEELLRRQLGARILAAIGDPQITEIIVNEDGRVWFESYCKGMHEAGFRLSASQVESLIGAAVAAGGALPWDAPLTTLQNDLQGPVAHAITTAAIIGTGIMWSVSEHGTGVRKMSSLAFGGSRAARVEN
jgi:type IV secretory pathway VirB2 component (pilin)